MQKHFLPSKADALDPAFLRCSGQLHTAYGMPSESSVNTAQLARHCSVQQTLTNGMQILGAVLGALLQIALVPGVHWGQQPDSPGCYDPNDDLTAAGAWGWETVLT